MLIPIFDGKSEVAIGADEHSFPLGGFQLYVLQDGLGSASGDDSADRLEGSRERSARAREFHKQVLPPRGDAFGASVK